MGRRYDQPEELAGQLQEMVDKINWHGASPGRWWIPVLVVLVILFIVAAGLSCFYTVEPDGQAVVKRFGKVSSIAGPGLHFKMPFGIDRQYFVPTERVLKEEFGFRTVSTEQRTVYEKGVDRSEESLMLTGDLKVIDVEWVVQYRVEDPDLWLHQVQDNVKTIRDISEAVMRRIVGNSLGSDVLTEKRVKVAQLARDEIQEILASFEMGIRIQTVELQDVTPPEPVKPAFNEVNEAEQEKEKLINEAEKKRNTVIPRAQGEAKQVLEEAEGYRANRVNKAKGEAERFTAIYKEYQNAPEITRRRLYLEMIDEVLPALGQVYITEEGQSQPLPLINLGDKGTSPLRATAKGGK